MIVSGQLLPKGEIGDKNAVFLALYAKDTNTSVTKLLMITRHDGSRGFVGGKVDEGETLKEGLSREFTEELGLALAYQMRGGLEHLCTHRISDPDCSASFNSHLFVCKVDEGLLYFIQDECEMSRQEVSGVDLMHMSEKTLHSIKNSALAPTVLEELTELIIEGII